jgi:PAS domain S-box-containing protein
MRVGELATRTGVGVSTLRAWERRFGLIEPQRSPGGQRRYTEEDVERVSAVRRLVAEGFTLAAAVSRVRSEGAAALPAGEGEASLLRQIIQAINGGIWVGRDGHPRYANRRMAEMLGCSLDDLLAHTSFDFMDPDAARVARGRLGAARAGMRLRFETELRRFDGSTFMADISSSPLFDRAGRYEGSVAIVHDITLGDDAETQARFRAAVLDTVGEAVIAASPEGLITYVNPAAERLFGWSPDVIGQSGFGLASAMGSAREAAEVYASVRAGRSFTGELPMLREDGTGFMGHLTGAPLMSTRNEVVGLVVVIRDLSGA